MIDFEFNKKELRRIKTRITKKNNKVRLRFPLFADEYLTDFNKESELEIKRIHDQSELYERLILNRADWWHEIEKYKRILTNANRRDIIFKVYRHAMKLHLGPEYYCDGLCRHIAFALDLIPYEVSHMIENGLNPFYDDHYREKNYIR